MVKRNPKFNQSGCKDLTAYEAIKNVTNEQEERDKRVHNFIKCLKVIIDVSGFQLLNRIAIKDKTSGKEYW